MALTTDILHYDGLGTRRSQVHNATLNMYTSSEQPNTFIYTRTGDSFHRTGDAVRKRVGGLGGRVLGPHDAHRLYIQSFEKAAVVPFRTHGWNHSLNMSGN
ncbi:hypothetical protein PM082_010784 [Marasmius tenuissimus]|nr:hypothetical protein PM082_010784 [Marasmius tenuissimus]